MVSVQTTIEAKNHSHFTNKFEILDYMASVLKRIEEEWGASASVHT